MGNGVGKKRSCRRSSYAAGDLSNIFMPKGLCINSSSILCGSPGGRVEALDTSWDLGIVA